MADENRYLGCSGTFAQGGLYEKLSFAICSIAFNNVIVNAVLCRSACVLCGFAGRFF